MKQVARLLGEMIGARVIDAYAVFGAVAQMRYTQAVATLDADIRVVARQSTGIDVLGPLYRFCESRGYLPQGEAIRVGEWPVQFIPVFDSLTEEAVRQAESGDIDGVPVRVVRADHLAVMALKTGRPKDYARILALLEAEALSTAEIGRLARRHGLDKEWATFRKRFLDD